MKKKMTLAEIAKLAGVNSSTVSRVLHEDPKAKISDYVRKKVLRICDKYNYRPSASARAVASGLTYRIGLILGALEQDLSSPVFALFTRGLCNELQKNNYTLSILWAGQPGDTLDRNLTDFLMSDIADGYVLGSAMLQSGIPEKIREMKRPLAYLADNISYYPDGFCGVCSTSRNACKQIWQRIPAEYYGRILYVCGASNDAKFADVTEAAKALQIPTDVITRHDLNEKSPGFPFDRNNAIQWAESHLDLLRRQKLLWCGADLTALGIADVLKRNGIIPGRDVYLIGYDNIEALNMYHEEPFLTTIDPHQEAMGQQLAMLLLQIIRGQKTETEKIPVEAELILRQSYQ